MKPFWDNLFFGREECSMPKEECAKKAGQSIRDDLDRIERAIKSYDLRKALGYIKEYKGDY